MLASTCRACCWCTRCVCQSLTANANAIPSTTENVSIASFSAFERTQATNDTFSLLACDGRLAAGGNGHRYLPSRRALRGSARSPVVRVTPPDPHGQRRVDDRSEEHT